MGHRANFVIVEQGAARAYFDQWAAMHCIYLFNDGPIAAVEALDDMEHVTELLDWAFAEGGYLIDFDRRFAVVFGVPFEEDDAIQEMDGTTATTVKTINEALSVNVRAYLQHIAPAWKGWKLSWDNRGVDAFSAYLHDRDISSIVMQPPSHPSTIDPPEIFQA